MSRFGDGIGVGSDLVQAAEVAVAAALLPLAGRTPDLAVVFVSGDPADITKAGERACELTGAAATVGCSAVGVIGGDQGLEDASAVSVFVAVLPGASLRTFHLEVMPAEAGAAVVGLPARGSGGEEVGLLLADPFSFPVDGFVSQAATSLTGLPFVGGVAHGGGGPGTTRMWVDGRTVDRGAVGVLIEGARARVLVSQGCRPVGPAMTVTEADGNVIHGLAGVPALARVRQLLAELPPPDQALASSGLQLGIAADEYTEDQEYLVRAIVGKDPAGSGLVVGDLVKVGQTVQFHVRDADAADADLHAVLARGPGGPVGGALLFSCDGRGAALFGPSYGGASHDGAVVRSALAADAVAGFFAGGEIAPVGGRSHLHSLSAAVLAFP